MSRLILLGILPAARSRAANVGVENDTKLPFVPNPSNDSFLPFLDAAQCGATALLRAKHKGHISESSPLEDFSRRR